MYTHTFVMHCLAEDRQAERVKEAEDEYVRRQATRRRRLERRRQRAERELVAAWRRVERAQSALSPG